MDVTLKELPELMWQCTEIDEPFMVWGGPGIGKSSFNRQIIEKKRETNPDYNFWGLDGIFHDPIDFKGIPSIKDGKTTWNKPDFFPEKPDGYVFMDELNGSLPAVQLVLQQLLLEKRIGKHYLPKGWSVGAAGNRETDRAVTNRMPQPLRDRIIHFFVDIHAKESFDAWKTWAMRNSIDFSIIAYLSWRPENLYTFDPKKNEYSYCTLRSWEKVSKICQKVSDEKMQNLLISNKIGDAVASEFSGFRKMMNDLPNIAEIIRNPEKSAIPQALDVLYAVMGALTKKATKQNLGNIVKYATKMPPEFSWILVNDLKELNFNLEMIPEYTEWFRKHQSSFMAI